MARKKKEPRIGDHALSGKTVVFLGQFGYWPEVLGARPEAAALRRGAIVTDEIDETVDVVVIGDLRAAGRAANKLKAEKLAARTGRPEILDEPAYRELVRIDLTGKHFLFIGGFDCSPNESSDALLAKMVKNVGAEVDTALSTDLDYLVVGRRRGDKKVATLNAARKLIEGGAKLSVIEEEHFLALVHRDLTPTSAAPEDTFAAFMSQLHATTESAKVGRALAMLKKDAFKLFTKLDEKQLIGVVQSQTETDKIYAPWLSADGRYGCCAQDLELCMGLQGSVCKHLLVLIVGLVRTGQLDETRVVPWLRTARGKRPKMDSDACAEAFITYKGAEAGTIDWRPTETVPEDFYAL